MLLVVRVSNEAWPQASCWVEAATCVEDVDQLGNEKAQADSDRSNERRLVLFFGEQEDREDEFDNVRTASMNRPWTSEVPPARVVRTLRGVGSMTRTRALAAMPPATWAAKRQIARIRGMALTMNMANVTWRHVSLRLVQGERSGAEAFPKVRLSNARGRVKENKGLTVGLNRPLEMRKNT
jgi:hypothetical protein